MFSPGTRNMSDAIYCHYAAPVDSRTNTTRYLDIFKVKYYFLFS